MTSQLWRNATPAEGEIHTINQGMVGKNQGWSVRLAFKARALSTALNALVDRMNDEMATGFRRLTVALCQRT